MSDTNKDHRKLPQTVEVLLEDPDGIVRQQVGGFIDFIREHAVVGVTIGFIVGLQAQTLIKQLVSSFVTPLLNFVVGAGLQKREWTIHGKHTQTFAWGAFLYALVDFLFVLLFIYLIVKIFRLDKLDKSSAKAKKRKHRKG
jgi:large-conductance mechanosensitive channel